MKKITPVCALLSLVCSFYASAEWTGDNINGYYKYRRISDLHVGQIDGGNYFCIKLVSADINVSYTPITMCSLSNEGVWSYSFKVLQEQARYFYATGQSIMAYYQTGVWTYKPFLDTFTDKALIGFSTCSATECFGPTPKE
ncbi:TPA: subtilase cytotoxin subunit B [Salmonella enterica subsp. enterica serovar Elomrane]|nr:subtilase cytotoxin subunit B [Salmonella enterica subsp. enterica serovar Elomrane]